MRFKARVALTVVVVAGLAAMACGSKRKGGYSNNPNFGGSGNAGGSGGSGNASGSGGSGTGGNSNFGGGGPGCDGTKSPAEDACVIHETYAVFVSPNGDDLEGDGSRAKPFKTFEHAVSTAVNEKKRVYACATSGAFDGQITLDSYADGVSLYGGFDCSSWDYKSGTRTQLTGPSGGVIVLQDLVTGTTIQDFEISAKAATSPASPSIGIVVGGSKNVKLARLKVAAGTGAPGLAGYTTPGIAASGKNGNPGHAQCGADTKGGAETVTGCGFPESKGGSGGIAGVGTSNGGSGTDGEPKLGGGLGGLGQDDTLVGGWSCGSVGNGKNGKPGADGQNGAGSTSPGKLTLSGWTSSAGGFGTDGGHGQGGGGGGGAKAPSYCAGGQLFGATGGGGGSGGCGGIGGEGGKGGGGSIALTSYESDVTIEDSDFVASMGGVGGAGGTGQQGGSGSSGALGGSGACAGGAGAKGGNAGHGGGGAGGPSIGIAWKGTKPLRTGGSIKIASVAAAGGPDGVGQTVGAGAGGLGLLADEHEFQ